MLRALKAIFRPMTHASEQRRVGDRTLLVLRFAGTANRTRAADYINGVLRGMREEPVHGFVLDFAEVTYAFGNDSTFWVLQNFTYVENRFIRVIPGRRSEEGLTVLMRVWPQFVSPTVDGAISAFAAAAD